MKKPEYQTNTSYVIYVAATPAKVWRALTQGKMTAQYFFGRRIEIKLRRGGKFRFWQPDGTLDVEGKVVECEAPHRLAVTWRVMWIPEMRKLPDCLVTYRLDDLGKVTRLTMTEGHQIKLSEAMLEGGRRGWPVILSSLKSLLETRKPLPKFDFMGENKKVLERMKKQAGSAGRK